MKVCNQKMFRKNSVLLIDGWKNENSNTKNVACLLQTANGDSMFLESYDLTRTCETEEELLKIVEKCTVLAKKKRNTVIYAILSDKTR